MSKIRLKTPNQNTNYTPAKDKPTNEKRGEALRHTNVIV